MFLQLKTKLIAKLNLLYDFDILIESPKTEVSDLAIPLFRLAKKTGKNISDLANEIKVYLSDEPLLDKMIFVNGFLNIYLKRALYAQNVLDEINHKGSYYASIKEKDKIVCIDYSSPNIAKNFNVGHLRSTVIGAALYRLYEKRGYKAIGINHLGDWGTQFGKLIVAYQLWGKEEGLKEEPVEYLQTLYVKFHEKAKDNPKLEQQARNVFKSLEENDPLVIKLWEKFKDLSLIEFKKTYDLLGVKFDYNQGESFYNDKTDEVVNELSEKDLLITDQEALVVRLDQYNMPPALIKRADGATLYMTRDLAALFYRYKEFKFDKILYVVGNEQKLHFKQLKQVSDLMGYNFDLEHVNFGLVLMDGKKMTTRGGKAVNLNEVIMEAIHNANEAISLKNPTLENKDEVAKAVGIGAIVFNDLKNDRNLDIDFDLKQMLSFEGLTGPYLQYSSVRINSMLKGQTILDAKDLSVYEDEVVFKLVLQLSQFSQILDKAVSENGPHVLSRYLLALAQSFNQFYGSYKVIVDNLKKRSSNLYFIKAIKTVIDEGLRLLGIKSLEEM